MAQPKGYLNLSKSQHQKLEFLLTKNDLTEKEALSLDILQKKRSLYLNPPVLAAGAENYLVEIYSRERYNIKKASAGGIAKSTQIKGFALEKEGLELLSKIDNIHYKKEVDAISDDYFIGVCDILCPSKSKLIEIKTSWNAANFMQVKKRNYKLPSEIYGQVQGYLHLYNLPKGQICYVLVNTPPHLIEQEWANLFKRYSYGEITREKYDEGCYKLEGFYDYNKIPEKKRIIRIDVDYSPAYIAKAKIKVDLARVWLNDFEKSFFSKKNILAKTESYLNTKETESDDDDDFTP